MADITMCSGDGCSTKESCYRFKAPVNEFIVLLYGSTW